MDNEEDYLYMNNEKAISKLNSLEWSLFDKAKRIGQEIIKNNPEYQTDIRYTTYTTLSSIFRAFRIFFIFKDTYMDKEEWQKANYGKYFSDLNKFLPMNESDRIPIIKEFYQQMPTDSYNFLLVGAYNSTFSILESRIRMFYNYFFDKSKQGEINDDRNLKKLFTKFLIDLNLTHISIGLEFFSNVRNSVHNNGVHTKKDLFIYYKGKHYEFQKGKATRYGDPLDLLITKIMPDVRTILDKIIERLNHFNNVNDPFALS